LSFDEGLEFVGYKNSGLFSMLNIYKVDNKIAVSGGSVLGSTEDGAIINLRLKIPEGAEAGKVYELNWDRINLLSSMNGSVEAAIICGEVTIIEKDKMLMGDLNYDEIIDSDDAIIVLKIFNDLMLGKNHLAEVELKVADIDGDGEVTSSDAVLILKYNNLCMLY